jgi:NTP pyrophosphatase (non-canonical NTP hydrolase)
MDEKAAYGQDPAMYYTLGICGEAGEMGNKIVKALRNGNDPEAVKEAVKSELPDVFIYSAVLAYVLDIDITRLVNDKVQVVMERARNGYYGGPLPKPD